MLSGNKVWPLKKKTKKKPNPRDNCGELLLGITRIGLFNQYNDPLAQGISKSNLILKMHL